MQNVVSKTDHNAVFASKLQKYSVFGEKNDNKFANVEKKSYLCVANMCAITITNNI